MCTAETFNLSQLEKLHCIDMSRLWGTGCDSFQEGTMPRQRLTPCTQASFTQEGSHLRFMLLQRGPVVFGRHIVRSARRALAWMRRTVLAICAAASAQEAGTAATTAARPAQNPAAPAGAAAAVAGFHASELAGEARAPPGSTDSHVGRSSRDPQADGQQRALGASGDLRLGPQLVTSDSLLRGPAAFPGAPPPVSATNKMQRRVLLLEAMRSSLAEALSEV
jgi:hypothetical protein